MARKRTPEEQEARDMNYAAHHVGNIGESCCHMHGHHGSMADHMPDIPKVTGVRSRR